MTKRYVICADPACTFVKEGRKETIQRCLWCGGPVLDECPHCEPHGITFGLPPSRYFTDRRQQVCENCGKRIKTSPEKGSPPETPRLSLVPKERPRKKYSKRGQNPGENDGPSGTPGKPA